MSHLVSIILPVYNGEMYIAQAIESILTQTHKQFELIIVNDCSTDKTLGIITDYSQQDKRIIIVNNASNKKLPTSLNIGHKKAIGDFITWTSDDNILAPNFLEGLITALINKKADIVYSNYQVIDGQGNVKRTHTAGAVEHILFGNEIGASFLYKKEVFNALNGYDKSLFLLEDYDFWLRASLRYKFYHLNRVLYEYRLHTESLTSNIHLNASVKEKHKLGVLKMFGNIANQLSWKKETLDFIVSHFVNQPIPIVKLLGKKHNIEEDILKFNSPYFNKGKVLNGLNLILRKHLILDANNKNLKTLLTVYKKDKQLLLNPNFSKKSTLTYILKSIFNFL